MANKQQVKKKLNNKNHIPDTQSTNREFCAYAKKCGGCQLQNMDYQRQLAYKQSKVVKLIGRYGKVKPIIGMDNPFFYRNKVQAAFGLTRRRQVISGVYQSSSHRIVNVDKCMIEDQKADEIIVSIRHLLTEFGILPYNEDSRMGFLRHVLVKRGFSTNEIMVVLIGSKPIFPQKKKLVDKLLKMYPEITTIIFNVNNKDTSMLLGDREEVLYGKGYIEDVLCGYRFRISAKSFYQINPVQTEKLYSTAIKFAELSSNEYVIDAYCGIGTIGMIASKASKAVLGIELNKDAVKDAILNAKINKVNNIEFIVGDAGNEMVGLAEQGIKADVVFMDPPRAGSDKKFLKCLCLLAPSKIVYISCNPETQSRDLYYLTNHGYSVKKIQPVDMFPYTNHVETVVLLSKMNTTKYLLMD